MTESKSRKNFEIDNSSTSYRLDVMSRHCENNEILEISFVDKFEFFETEHKLNYEDFDFVNYDYRIKK